jgi:hypothetical protein
MKRKLLLKEYDQIYESETRCCPLCGDLLVKHYLNTDLEDFDWHCVNCNFTSDNLDESEECQ